MLHSGHEGFGIIQGVALPIHLYEQVGEEPIVAVLAFKNAGMQAPPEGQSSASAEEAFQDGQEIWPAHSMSMPMPMAIGGKQRGHVHQFLMEIPLLPSSFSRMGNLSAWCRAEQSRAESSAMLSPPSVIVVG